MWSILADLAIGLADLVLDVLLFRWLRRKHGRRDRGIAEDAFVVARFDFVTTVFIALVCAGLILLLALGFGLPAGWSVGIGVAAGSIWGVWRYFRLIRAQ